MAKGTELGGTKVQTPSQEQGCDGTEGESVSTGGGRGDCVGDGKLRQTSLQQLDSCL